jgi:hypothetical protein
VHVSPAPRGVPTEASELDISLGPPLPAPLALIETSLAPLPFTVPVLAPLLPLTMPAVATELLPLAIVTDPAFAPESSPLLMRELLAEPALVPMLPAPSLVTPVRPPQPAIAMGTNSSAEHRAWLRAEGSSTVHVIAPHGTQGSPGSESEGTPWSSFAARERAALVGYRVDAYAATISGTGDTYGLLAQRNPMLLLRPGPLRT